MDPKLKTHAANVLNKKSHLRMAQFHQRSYSFYARRSRMCKKRQSSQHSHLALSGSTSVKAVRRTLMKLTHGSLESPGTTIDCKVFCAQNLFLLSDFGRAKNVGYVFGSQAVLRCPYPLKEAKS